MRFSIRRLYSRSVRTQNVAGAVLVGVGGLLLVATAAYYGYGFVARSNLGDLSFNMDRPSVMPESVAPDDQVTAAIEETLSQESVGATTFGPLQGGAEGMASVRSPDVQPSYPGTIAALETFVDHGLDGQPDREASVAIGIESAAKVVGASDVLESPDGSVTEEVVEPVTPVEGELTVAGPPLAPTAESAGTVAPGTPGGSDSGRADASDELSMAGAVVPTSEDPVSGETSAPTGLVPENTIEEESRPSGSQAAIAIADNPAGEAGPGTAAPGATDALDDKSAGTPSIEEFFSLSMEAMEAKADANAQVIEASRVEALSYSLPTLVELERGLTAATRIRIPAVRVDSDVKELEVVSTGDGYAWETPKWLVGHVPTTAVAGGQGEGWYFGHLQSPIKREGNVFLNLPEIPGLLGEGEPVYIFLEADNRKFVYQAYKTDTVHEDDLRITDSGNQDITLVTCVPEFYYDHRLMVTAALVGVSES